MPVLSGFPVFNRTASGLLFEQLGKMRIISIPNLACDRIYRLMSRFKQMLGRSNPGLDDIIAERNTRFLLKSLAK